jgi:hypothetical protein
MPADKLTPRALNRATLARQLLLDRSALTPARAITHLAGLQAQAPLAPYVGLWTRLAAFRPQQLENLMNERGVLRAHLMRHTVHLVDARDFLRFRPLFQPLLSQGLRGNLARRLDRVDLAELRAEAASLLAQAPLTRTQLAQALAPRWPGHDPGLLANAAAQSLVLVQIPPRGLWSQTGPAVWALASAWLGSQDDPDPLRSVEELVLRYLAGCARGPAPAAPRCSTWPTRRRTLIPVSRLRPASCPNTTTCCSPTPNVPGSSRTAAPSRSRRATAPPSAPCSSTAAGRPTGGSARNRASSRSARTSR